MSCVQIYRAWAINNAAWTRKGDVQTRLMHKQFPSYLTTTPLLIESNVGRTAHGTYGRCLMRPATVARTTS
jgi:hypothetical protein